MLCSVELPRRSRSEAEEKNNEHSPPNRKDPATYSGSANPSGASPTLLRIVVALFCRASPLAASSLPAKQHTEELSQSNTPRRKEAPPVPFLAIQPFGFLLPVLPLLLPLFLALYLLLCTLNDPRLATRNLSSGLCSIFPARDYFPCASSIIQAPLLPRRVHALVRLVGFIVQRVSHLQPAVSSLQFVVCLQSAACSPWRL